MDFQETVSYLYSRLPVFQHVGKSAYTNKLDNIIAFCNHLQNPQDGFKSIHVAGTNGKGSTSHMLAAVLQLSGYKVGLYTSPHLKRFTERIKINGEEIHEDFVVQFVEQHKQFIESLSPSFFEATVAMAFDYFRHQEVDIAVVEVGLGGRLDSTNIINPTVSVITNISYDHMDILGDTLEKIAFEKSGVIKPNVPVVVGEVTPETEHVFKVRAEHCGSEFILVRPKIHSQYPDRPVYQHKNMSTVEAVVDVLKNKGYAINDKACAEGIRDFETLTGLKGRWQKIQEAPQVVIDTAHNQAGISMMVEQLQTTSYQALRIVIGFVKDKELDKVLPLLPTHAVYYFTQPSNLRALPVEVLTEHASNFGLFGDGYSDVNIALEKAKGDAGIDDLILVCGSNFVVADLNCI